MKKLELMTFKEYFYTVNKHGKMHDSDSYDGYNIDSYNTYDSAQEYQKLINKFKSHGLYFEIKEKKIDRWEFNYCKHDENGDILRDEKGLALSMTMEDKAKHIKPRYEYEHAIIESRTQKIIGRTQDEWGALLITMANEFKGMGLGEKLLQVHREKYPFRDSGGHTPQGKLALYHTYQRKVSKFLSSGNYREALINKEIKMDKIKEILASASIGGYDDGLDSALNFETYQERKKRKEKESFEKDYDMFKPEDFMLHIDSNFAILYNKKAFNMMTNYDDREDFFIEQGLLGYAYIGGTYNTDSVPKLFRLHGKNEKLKTYMAEVAMNLFVNEPVRVFEDDLKYISNKVKENSLEGFNKDSMTEFTLQNKTLDNLDILSFLDKKFRKENDQYDEKWILIHEAMHAWSEQEIKESLEEKKKLKMR